MQHLLISRRTALKMLGATSAALATSSCLTANARAQNSVKRILADSPDVLADGAGNDFSPVDRSLSDVAAKVFSGDQPDRAHEILWNRDGYIQSHGGIPAPSEKAKVVVIGGGLSGIFSTYFLKDLNPILLERAPRLGGNARAESYRGIDYSIGSAYFAEPEKDSTLKKMLDDVGATSICTPSSEEGPVIINSKIFTQFWEGQSDASAKAQFLKLKKIITEDVQYPEIPSESDEARQYVNQLDAYTFKAFLESKMGSALHPHLESFIEAYCWSALGASMSVLSAAAGINFLASEFKTLWIPKGGNAAVAEKVLLKLKSVLPANSIRNSSIVVDVTVKADRVWVTYANASDQLKTIEAQSVILAVPKFVASKIITGIEADRVSAIREIAYNPYLVANFILSKKIASKSYDTYFLGDGHISSTNAAEESTKRRVTDVVIGTFADSNASTSILSLYRPLPDFNFRDAIYSNDAFEQFSKDFVDQAQKEILPAFGVQMSDVKDVRLARWGHSLSIAKVGVYKNGTVDRIKKPFGARVYFAEQDNWALPCLEVCFGEAEVASRMARKIIQ